MERGENMESVPTDLMLEIFTRLPAKSVARFRILSKYWESMLRSPDFSKLFLTRSSTRPRLLFAIERFRYNEWQFFSTPQPQNRYETSSHVDFHTKFKGDVSRHACSYASGLIYFPNVQIAAADTALICNPITGMYVSLPDLMKYRKSRGFLGFDPNDKQFKVMSEAYPFSYLKDRHNILTLGSGELKWRSTIPCAAYKISWSEGICINGVLYYFAEVDGGTSFVIVRFDVRSEEFKFIDAKRFIYQIVYFSGFCLVNYKGKLGGINCQYGNVGGRRTVELYMWVLEDFEKQEWMDYKYTFPEIEVLGSRDLSVAGVTASGDIVLVMKFTCKPFYVFYFNPERNTLQSVEIQGFGADLEVVENRCEVFAFVDHVEYLSVNDAKQLKSSIYDIKQHCSWCKKKLEPNKEWRHVRINRGVYSFADHVEDLSFNNDAEQLKPSSFNIKHICSCCSYDNGVRRERNERDISEDEDRRRREEYKRVKQ